MIRKILKWFIYTVVVLGILAYAYIIYPLWGYPFNNQRHGNPPLTPAWALECWLWEDDVNTAAYVDELLEGYKQHDIPVRTVILDSPWSLRYNDFEVDTVLYPKPKQWFKKLENQDYRVVLWMTSMVNHTNKDTHIKDASNWYNNAKDKGYLISSKKSNKWWKGNGGFIDYTNEEAMTWWRNLQQEVFDLGIDGWKLDGTATLFMSDIAGIPLFYKKSSQGLMTTRKYMDLYYRQEYQHGLLQNPEFVTLSRSMDRGYHPEGFAPIDASPVNWVGDQEHKWVSEDMIAESDHQDDLALEGVQGFEAAINSILKSADRGYNIIGSDVAGFSGNTIPPRLYIRWTQFSTFCGLFMNGGHGERRLWKRTEEELNIIRTYSWLHTELVPYMYHYVHSAHQGGDRLQTPLEKGKFQYMFGNELMIAPIYQDRLERKVWLPKGEWRYWFDDNDLLQGGKEIEQSFPLDEYPVFIKEGAIIPMHIERSYTQIGDENNKDFITWLIYPKTTNQFKYYNTLDDGQTILEYHQTDNTLEIKLIGEPIANIFRIHSKVKPKQVIIDSKVVSNDHWTYNSENNKIVIKHKMQSNESSCQIEF